jgi:DNA polymerase-3 subunit beta
VKFTATREQLLAPVNAVISATKSGGTTMPILSHLMLWAGAQNMSLTASDGEVELVAQTEIQSEPGQISVPAKKLHDIVKSLPAGAEIKFEVGEQGRAVLKSGRSRFTLATLPAEQFPLMQNLKETDLLKIAKPTLLRLLTKTKFAMAEMDVRYYLNGMLFEIDSYQERTGLRTVATDGHRLAMCSTDNFNSGTKSVIVPRKAIAELERIAHGDGEIAMGFDESSLRVATDSLTLQCKLIQGRFPDYERVLPKASTTKAKLPRASLLESLNRASILCNGKYKGVKFDFGPSRLCMTSNNAEDEGSVEEVGSEHDGPKVEVGFNVSYMRDAISAVQDETVEIGLTDANSTCLMRDSSGAAFVVMPMRI